MTPPMAATRRRNPFATRHTSPGTLRPRDQHGEPLDIAALAARARSLPVAALVGPHGAGKSNLLRAVARHLAAEGRLAATVRVRSPGDGWGVVQAVRAAPRATTLCVDGWEALGGVWPAIARWVAWRRRVGLLVTCHRATGVPELVRCTTTPALLRRLVDDLPDHGGLITDADIAAAFTTRQGDVREALYDLYDRFERRSRGD